MMTLEEVLAVMVEAEQEGKDVVRLHTGEPSIYGAVQEQMQELDARKLAYDSTPGVSACFGAAASLNLEYTLPDISQSLIITRMEGRTAVPEKESIEAFAAHQCSMAIYLSTGMLEKLSERLIKGGYSKDTTAALAYKVSWPEEEIYICTVETLAQTAAEHGITKTALVLVGDVINKSGYSKSRLYAEDFSTEFRAAKKIIRRRKENAVIEMECHQLYRKGIRACRKDKKTFQRAAASCEIHTYHGRKQVENLNAWTKEQFSLRNAIIFIGACGIAVRTIAPFLKDKLTDSPVLVLDEAGNYVIPLLSGHVGGANEIALQLAELLGAVPVITTATDINNAFAIDVFAKKHDLSIDKKEGIKKVSAKVLEKKKLSMTIAPEYAAKVDVAIGTPEDGQKPEPLLTLIPKEYILGIGCRRNKEEQELKAFAENCLKEAGVDWKQIRAIASIDKKKDEKAILKLAAEHGIPFLIFDAETLSRVPGTFDTSAFVASQVGVDNVCERAAMAACRDNGRLVLQKRAENGMTLAIAKEDWRLTLYEE